MRAEETLSPFPRSELISAHSKHGCNQMRPHYDRGDGLHPSDLGYGAMGDAIDLALRADIAK